jgi:cellulose 1,4-beta-cellobiosidase
MYSAVALLSLFALARGQQVGTNTAETHPAMTWQTCKAGGTCTTNSGGKVVLDANWRWVHATTGYTNCYTGNTWNATICPDGTTCAENCAVDGADYSGTYGITTSTDSLTLKFVTTGTNTNIGSRVYLMASDTAYEIFKVRNQEFTFDVDVSGLPCGLNGALYFSQMDADGGLAKYPNNKAGAKYGTGYCDSQCPRDIKFINGIANVAGWVASPNDTNAGTGNMGTCCNEMDVWEANSMSAAYTPHPCTVSGQTMCTGTDCAITSRYTGICDPDGCDFNSYRMGDTTFYGKAMTVDTSQKFTVVTQFITSDNTANTAVTEIRRFYVQNGKTIPNSQSTIPGVTGNSITDSFCTAQKTAFGDTNSYSAHGGMKNMDVGFDAGMVLVMSIWDDHAASMLWLDSTYPANASATALGAARGSCATTSGMPTQVEAQSPNAQVIFSNIKFGDIGSTFNQTSTTTTTAPAGGPTTSPPPTSTGTSPKYGQCGGIGYTGPTTCAAGSTCTVSNPYYSQCL